jgi:undecaprenyl-diphosphatase
MNELQAFLLGVIQGLTEFLPVSSSGHLEIGHSLLRIQNQNNLLFAVVVHTATVLSTLVVFRKDLVVILTGLFAFQWNSSTQYVAKLIVSSVLVILLGLFFKTQIEELFSGNLLMVGSMLMVTALLLFLTTLVQKGHKNISFFHALVMGLSQALAVIPGISRSGATIATGLLLKNHKEETTRFSFLMVLIPVLGAMGYDLLSGEFTLTPQTDLVPLLVGFVSAFVAGLIACTWMIRIVKKGKLIYFAIYCFCVGLIAIFAA